MLEPVSGPISPELGQNRRWMVAFSIIDTLPALIR
jgi:hypothetical protein